MELLIIPAWLALCKLTENLPAKTISRLAAIFD